MRVIRRVDKRYEPTLDERILVEGFLPKRYLAISLRPQEVKHVIKVRDGSITVPIHYKVKDRDIVDWQLLADEENTLLSEEYFLRKIAREIPGFQNRKLRQVSGRIEKIVRNVILELDSEMHPAGLLISSGGDVTFARDLSEFNRLYSQIINDLNQFRFQSADNSLDDLLAAISDEEESVEDTLELNEDFFKNLRGTYSLTKAGLAISDGDVAETERQIVKVKSNLNPRLSTAYEGIRDSTKLLKSAERELSAIDQHSTSKQIIKSLDNSRKAYNSILKNVDSAFISRRLSETDKFYRILNAWNEDKQIIEVDKVSYDSEERMFSQMWTNYLELKNVNLAERALNGIDNIEDLLTALSKVRKGYDAIELEPYFDVADRRRLISNFKQRLETFRTAYNNGLYDSAEIEISALANKGISLINTLLQDTKIAANLKSGFNSGKIDEADKLLSSLSTKSEHIQKLEGQLRTVQKVDKLIYERELGDAIELLSSIEDPGKFALEQKEFIEKSQNLLESFASGRFDEVVAIEFKGNSKYFRILEPELTATKDVLNADKERIKNNFFSARELYLKANQVCKNPYILSKVEEIQNVAELLDEGFEAVRNEDIDKGNEIFTELKTKYDLPLLGDVKKLQEVIRKVSTVKILIKSSDKKSRESLEETLDELGDLIGPDAPAYIHPLEKVHEAKEKMPDHLETIKEYIFNGSFDLAGNYAKDQSVEKALGVSIVKYRSVINVCSALKDSIEKGNDLETIADSIRTFEGDQAIPKDMKSFMKNGLLYAYRTTLIATLDDLKMESSEQEINVSAIESKYTFYEENKVALEQQVRQVFVKEKDAEYFIKVLSRDEKNSLGFKMNLVKSNTQAYARKPTEENKEYLLKWVNITNEKIDEIRSDMVSISEEKTKWIKIIKRR